MRTAMKDDFLDLARRASKRNKDANVLCEPHAKDLEAHAKNHANSPCENELPKEIEGLSMAELKKEAAEDWGWFIQDPKALETFAHSLATSRLLKAGIVPDHYTSQTHCKHCGDVPIFEGVAPEVSGCPWCFVGGYTK